MEMRFRSLRIVGTVFKALAWATLVLGVIAGLIMLVSAAAGGLLGGASLGGRDAAAGLGALGALGGLFAGLVSGLAVMLSALLGFLVFYAYGDAIYLALAIEENTRETAHYLKGGDTYGQRL